MNPELFQRVGITPPKGCLLYGPPGTTLLYTQFVVLWFGAGYQSDLKQCQVSCSMYSNVSTSLDKHRRKKFVITCI